MKDVLWIIGTVLFALMPPDSAFAQSKRETIMIRRVQHLDASKLEGRLPRQDFASWFKSAVGSQAKLIWETNDCGEQTGAAQPGRDLPTCAQVEATLGDGRKVVVMIVVGTLRKGIAGKPLVKDAFIQRGDQFFSVSKLADLEEMLKKTAL